MWRRFSVCIIPRRAAFNKQEWPSRSNYAGYGDCPRYSTVKFEVLFWKLRKQRNSMLSFVNNFQLLIICMIFHNHVKLVFIEASNSCRLPSPGFAWKNNFLQNVKCFELGLIGACFALQGLFFLRVVSSKGKWRVEQGEEAVAAVAVEIRPEDPEMCRSKSRLPQEEEEDREVLRQRKQLKLRLLFHRDHL